MLLVDGSNITFTMKDIFIILFSIFNRLRLLLFSKGKINLKGIFYLVKINQSPNNFTALNKVDIRNTVILVKGSNNKIDCNNTYIDKSSITITGDNNCVSISEGVEMRNATIIIRGNGCILEIGKNTTFGGIRIVNVGKNNKISIGESCMFSDNIEVWASDTHPIFNKHGEWINKERPISIGNGVWVGSRVSILKGVKIGEGSIIGMGSLVTKDISHHTIAAGSPSRELVDGVSWRLDYPIQ